MRSPKQKSSRRRDAVKNTAIRKFPRKKTPIRVALQPSSPLMERICDGIGAVIGNEIWCIDQAVRDQFDDSLNLDAAMRQGRETENRWDYLLGHSSSSEIIALEPHSAKDDQISTVIRKKQRALIQLRGHFLDGKRVAKWIWVASGKTQFTQFDRAQRRLDQEGIQFAGNRLARKHLPK